MESEYQTVGQMYERLRLMIRVLPARLRKAADSGFLLGQAPNGSAADVQSPGDFGFAGALAE